MIAVYVFGGIMLLLIIAVLVGSVVEKEPTDSRARELSAERQQERAIEALREIEFEYQTGKLLEADYLQLRGLYAQQAIGARDKIAGRGSEPGEAPRRCHACGEPTGGPVRFCPRCGAAQSGPSPGSAESRQ